MSCPTCDHTMALLCNHEDMRYAHCERCGTVKVRLFGDCTISPPRVYVPKLVARVNQFRLLIEDGKLGRKSDALKAMHRLGIDEATLLPGDRP